MKRFAFIITVSALSFLTATNALALSCLWISPEQATNLYLVQLDNITYTDKTDANHWYGTADVEVLKIYRGNVDALQNIQQVKIQMSCSDVWGPPCPVTPVFEGGQYWILVEDEQYDFSIQSLWTGSCSGYQIPVSSQEELDQFEQTYAPDWISPQFESILPR